MVVSGIICGLSHVLSLLSGCSRPFCENLHARAEQGLKSVKFACRDRTVGMRAATPPTRLPARQRARQRRRASCSPAPGAHWPQMAACSTMHPCMHHAQAHCIRKSTYTLSSHERVSPYRIGLTERAINVISLLSAQTKQMSALGRLRDGIPQKSRADRTFGLE